MTHTYNSSTHEAEAVDYLSLRPHSEYQASQCYKYQDTVSNNNNKQSYNNKTLMFDSVNSERVRWYFFQWKPR